MYLDQRRACVVNQIVGSSPEIRRVFQFFKLLNHTNSACSKTPVACCFWRSLLASACRVSNQVMKPVSAADRIAAITGMIVWVLKAASFYKSSGSASNAATTSSVSQSVSHDQVAV